MRQRPRPAGRLGPFAVDGACHPSTADGDSTWSVSYDGTPPQLDCSGEGAMPQAVATPTDPVTLCCET